MSWPKTLGDDAEMLAAHLRNPGAEPRRTSTVVAPCCGRTCAADMVVDLRDVAVTGREWACDGCRWRMTKGPGARWTKPQLIRALGASVAEVRTEEAKRLRREASRSARDENRAFNAVEAMKKVRAELPDTGMPPGTEPPDD